MTPPTRARASTDYGIILARIFGGALLAGCVALAAAAGGATRWAPP